MAYTEFDGALDHEQPGYVEFNGELDKPESTTDKVKSTVSKGIDAGLSLFTPKKSIADQAQERSASLANTAAPQVSGVPIRRDYYAKAVAETPQGSTQPDTGITARVRNIAANDKQAQLGKRTVGNAFTSTEPDEGIGLIGTLKEGVKGTARNIGAAIDTARGNAGNVISAASDAKSDEKDPALESLLNDINARKKALGENPGWLDSIKAVGGAAINNPKGAGLLVAEQFPNSAVALGSGAAGMAAGSVFGPAGAVVGGIAGLFGANTALETGGKAIEAAADGTFSPTEQSRVLKEGAIKGGVITGIDAATLGLTNFIMGTTARAVERATVKTLADHGVDVSNKAAVLAASKNPAIVSAVQSSQKLAQAASNTLGQKIARVGGATGLETVGEGAGEYLGELAATGKADKVEAAIEALSSASQSMGEVAFTAARNKAKLSTIAGKPVEELSDSVLRYTANRGSERAKAAAQAELDRRATQGVDPAVANAPETTSEAVDRIIATGKDKADEIRSSVAPDAIQSNVLDELDHIADAGNMIEQNAPAAQSQPVPDAPTPEPVETLNAQLNALAAGNKPGMLLTPGEPMPHTLPPGVRSAEIPGRGTLLYRDDATLQAAMNGQMGTALGYGIDEKPVTDQVVTARDANGAVIQDVATDGSKSVLQAAKDVAGPRGSVEVRPVQDAMVERAGQQITSGDPMADTRRAAEKRMQEDKSWREKLSRMTDEELAASADSAVEHNNNAQVDTVKHFFGADTAAEFQSFGRRKRDRWLDENLTEEMDHYLNDRQVPEDLVIEFRQAASNFDTASAHDLGRSIAVISKDVDRPGFFETPEGTTFRNAMQYAKEKGWNLDEVVAGMKERGAEWGGRNLVELFPRLFGEQKPKSQQKSAPQRTLLQSATQETRSAPAPSIEDKSGAAQDTHPIRPLVESLINRRAAAKQGGKDLSNAIARAKEVMDGKRTDATVENRWFRLQAKAFEKADAESAGILRQIGEAVNGGKLESRTLGTIFERYAALGDEIGTAQQAISDAEEITGLRLGLRVVRAKLPPRNPARFMLDSRTLEVSENWNFERREGAQYIAEELFHAVDSLSSDRALSASSKRLDLKTGDIALEIINHQDGKGVYNEFFKYPMMENDLTDSVKKAELFARLGVLYFGEPARMQRYLPIAYGAFDGIFKFSIHPVSGEISRSLWSFSRRSVPLVREHGADGQNGTGDGGSPEGGQGAELGRLRKSIRTHFQANPGGAKVDFRRIGTRSFKTRLQAYKEKQARKSFKERLDAYRKRHGADTANSAVSDKRSERDGAGSDNSDNRRVSVADSDRISAIRERLKKAAFSRHKQNQESQKATHSGGLSVSDEHKSHVQVIVDAIRGGWKNAPEIIVVKDMHDPAIPERVRSVNTQQMSQGDVGQPEGFFYKGKVYIVASEMYSPRDVVRVVFHETLGHYGLRGVFGDELKPILKQIAALRRADVEKKARQYGLDMSIEKDRLIAAEEVLAELAQTNPQISFVKRAIAAIRAWLRKNIPALADMKMTDDEIIHSYLIPARDFVKGGKGAGANGDPAFQRVWHGTPHVWAPEPEFPHGRPRLDKMGTGEGAQAFGWGWYSAESKGVAQSYHDMLSGRDATKAEDIGTLDGVDFPKLSIEQRHALRMLKTWGTPEKAIAAAEKQGIADLDRVKVLRQIATGESTVTFKTGSLYSLDIPDSVLPRLLDWDKPLSEQTPEVRKALLKAMPELRGQAAKQDREDADLLAELLGEPAEINLNVQLPTTSAQDFYHSLVRKHHSDKAASEYLASIGIVGNRYLDGGSRNKGEGSFNYVIWDQKTLDKIALLERNGAKLDAIREAEAAFSRQSQTETPTFKKWFGNSKVVDADGRPLVVYHGTANDIKKFRTNRGAGGELGAGAYFTDSRADANTYSEGFDNRSGEYQTGANVMPVYLSLNNPFISTGAEDIPTRSKLIKQGYDGVIDIGSNGNQYVAFFPEQIKSAIGNNGNFDSNNANIRFSRKPGSTFDSPEPSRLDDLIYKLQNKHIDLKRVLESIRDTGAQMVDQWNTYLQEELFHGRAAKRTKDFVTQELKPLIAGLKLRGLSIDELDKYLHARHAEEANKLIAQRDPNMPDGGSGMTNQESRDYFANLDPEKKRKLEQVAKKVDDIIAKTRETYVSYGLIDQATADSWAQMFKHYVPLMREDKDGGMGIGQGFSIKGKESKHRTGSRRAVVDILANIALQREKAIVRGEKNRVAVSLYGLAKLNPNPDFWTLENVPQRHYDSETGQVVERPDPNYKERKNVVVAKILDSKGKVTERAVIFEKDNPRAMRMAQALKNLDATQLESLLGLSAKITRYFASVNTQYNPVFGVVNLVRDLQASLINLSSTKIAGHKAEVMKNVIPAIIGIYQASRAETKGNAQARSPMADLWDEMQKEGGMTGYRDLYKTSEDRANAIKRELDPTAWMNNGLGKFFTAGGTLKVPLAVAQKGAGWLFDLLSDYNQTLEGAMRLAVYKVALDNGLSKQQGGSIAKNISVNFNRKGQIGQQAGALYAFFNASMQGTARMAETLTSMDKGDISTLKLNQAGKRIVTGGLVLGAAQALALAAAGFDDDEPPEFVRERSLIIPIGGKKYITIPMPLGLHVIPNIGRMTTEFALDGFKHPAKRTVQLMGIFAEAFNPIGNAGFSTQTIMPTPLDPVAALLENKDWTGKPIAKEDFNKLSPTPGFSRNKDTASTPAKWIAEAINALSGGNKYVPGMLSPTADQIDYLAGQITGGVGREAGKLNQTAGAMMSGEDLPPHKMPLVGRFYGNAESQSSQGNAFYSNLKHINQLEAELKGRTKDKLPLDEFKAENPEYRLIEGANYAERAVSNLRRRKSDLIVQGAPKDQVKAIDTRITEVMTRLNNRVKEVRREARQ